MTNSQLALSLSNILTASGSNDMNNEALVCEM